MILKKTSAQIHSKILGKKEQNTPFWYLVIFQLVLCFLQGLNYDFRTLETVNPKGDLKSLRLRCKVFILTNSDFFTITEI